MRISSSRALLLTAVCISQLACSGADVERAPDDGLTGTAILSLVPVTGVTLDALNYVVMQGDSPAPIRQGIIPSQGAGSTINIALNLPPGRDYTLSVSGTSEQQGKDLVCTGAIGPFNMVGGGSVPLDVSFTCIDISNGEASNGVTVKTDACPDVQFGAITALPAAAVVSQSIALTASAQELNARQLSYLWLVSDPAVASITDATLPSATLTCLAPTVSAAVRVMAFNGQCSKTATTLFSCAQSP